VKRLLSVLVLLLLLAIPAVLFAKAETSKIIIKGADLSAPIEITDPKTLANFFVWTGTGTSCTGACSTPSTESFIVDWSQPIADHPSGLHRYEVSFYAKMPDERLIYVVFYEYDPATEHGYGPQRSIDRRIGVTETRWIAGWCAPDPNRELVRSLISLVLLRFTPSLVAAFSHRVSTIILVDVAGENRRLHQLRMVGVIGMFRQQPHSFPGEVRPRKARRP